jgi:UDP-N-acetylglucosamine acyltransferase
MHKALYRDDLTLDKAKEQITQLVKEKPESAPDVAMMLDFLNQASAQRGIIR